MTVGIRLRGAAGNVQVDSDYSVTVVGERGTITAANFNNNMPNFFLGSRHHVTFAAPYTSQAPPMVFLKFDNGPSGQWANVLSTFTMVGSPGNWTGFNVMLGLLTSSPVPTATNMSWFTAIPTPQVASGIKVGIRIRNPNTGLITFESGWPMVKFLSQTTNFVAQGRYAGIHGLLRYNVGYPPGGNVYFMANGLSGILDAASQVNYLWVGQEVGYEGTLTLYTNGTDDIPYQSFMWTVLFASPGV